MVSGATRWIAYLYLISMLAAVVTQLRPGEEVARAMYM